MKRMCGYGHVFSKDFCLDICPYCKVPLFKEYDTYVYIEKLKKYLTNKHLYSRSEMLNLLPRLPWFKDIENNEDQNRKNETWSDEEILLVKKYYENVGVSNANIWTKFTEEYLNRSIYALEHHLRLIIADLEINKYYYNDSNAFFFDWEKIDPQTLKQKEVVMNKSNEQQGLVKVEVLINEVLKDEKFVKFLQEVKQKTRITQFKSVTIAYCRSDRIKELLVDVQNRDISISHLKNILAGVAEDGCPTAISTDRNVIWDGQNRAIVCYLLDYDLPYMDIPCSELFHSRMEMIQRVNTKAKNWNNSDFINYFRKNGIEFFDHLERVNKELFGKTAKDCVLSLMLGRKETMGNLKKKELDKIEEIVKDAQWQHRFDIYFKYRKELNELFRLDEYSINSGFGYFLIKNDLFNDVDILHNFVERLKEYNPTTLLGKGNKIPQTDVNWKYFFEVLFKKYCYGKI